MAVLRATRARTPSWPGQPASTRASRATRPAETALPGRPACLKRAQLLRLSTVHLQRVTQPRVRATTPPVWVGTLALTRATTPTSLPAAVSTSAALTLRRTGPAARLRESAATQRRLPRRTVRWSAPREVSRGAHAKPARLKTLRPARRRRRPVRHAVQVTRRMRTRWRRTS